MDMRDVRIGLNLVPAVGSRISQRIIEYFKTSDSIISASESELLSVKGVGKVTAEAIASLDWQNDIEKEKLDAAGKGVSICVLGDLDYPERLKDIFDPPQVLYLKGRRSLLTFPMLAVVGSRTPTLYGKLAAERLSLELSESGLTIVSGFARGVDSVSHRAALGNNGYTVAVLGSGLNIVYPPENRKMFMEIAEKGLLLSEFPMNRRPDKMNFPRRNRIISGLSEGVLVVEAAEKSGSLITADFALEQGREVFAVPGNISSPKSRGTNSLLKKGGVLTETSEDVVNELSEKVKERLAESPAREIVRSEESVMSGEESALLNAVTDEAIHIDKLIKKVQLPPGMVSAILLKLEMKGFVRQLPGKFYILGNHARTRRK